MPLSTKEKSARHRERIKNDPAARERYLAQRRYRLISCMYRVCAKCCYDEVEVAITQAEETVTWNQWARKPVTDGHKSYTNFVKEAQTGTYAELLNLFNRKLDSLTIDKNTCFVCEIKVQLKMYFLSLFMFSSGGATE